jgi:hypothetical protein
MPQLEWHANAEIRLLYSKFFFIVKATCNDAAAALFLTLPCFLVVHAIVYRLFVDRHFGHQMSITFYLVSERMHNST